MSQSNVILFEVMPSVPTGSIIDYAGAAAPIDLMLCDGSAIDRIVNANLFAVIGETYGAGDGSTTFNLPDLRSRVSIGMGQGNGLTDRVLAEIGGEENHVLLEDELATHFHGIAAADSVGITNGPQNYYLMIAGNSAPAGLSLPHNTMQPFLVMNKIIKT
jgi:microcystin-dependent protein